MKTKSVDEAFDELMAEVGPRVIEEMAKDDLVHLDRKAFEFSDEHEAKMKEMIANLEKEDNKEETSHKVVPMRVGKKILILAATLVLILGIAISSVGAWRESFVKYFLIDKGEYSEIREKQSGREFVSGNIYFGYLPRGYESTTQKIYNDFTSISFEKDDYYIIYQSQNNQTGALEVDTENTKVEDIIVNGMDMIYLENDRQKTVTWYDNHTVHTLSTNDTRETLIKVAENMKFLE